jgi:acetylornithine deacetylase/succinyl-diaminopimelate desuccinylase-like protein
LSAPKSSATVRLLCDLIALPSVNPAFLPPNDPLAGEHQVTDFIAQKGRAAGLSVTFQDVLPGRRNVLLRYQPERASTRILLAPHMDTVGALDGSDAPFRPQISHGRVWGRGACDTKGSIAAMLGALLEVSAARQRPAQTEIIFAGLVDEETCQRGSRALVASGFKADLGVVGEPTRLAVVTAHKGDLWARLQTKGKAAHGACPDRGRSAIRIMAKAIQRLEGPYAHFIAKRSHPLLGHPTINVGTIQGGTQANIVPDTCTIEVDRRMLPGETGDSVRKEILLFLRRHGISASFDDIKGVPEPAMETDPALPMVQTFRRAMGRRRVEGVHYFCDAAVLSEGGTPCVVFGPGDIAQAHTAREWISIESLERGTALFRRFLQSLP